VDISEIMAHLSGPERRTARSFLDHLIRARNRPHEALLALAADFVAADVMTWRRARGPAASQLATRLDALQAALATARRELRLVAGTLADRFPIPQTWADLEEVKHLLRGQREMLYQADIWEREVIQPIKTDHARVVAQMEELRRLLRGTAPRGEPGRPPKYPAALVKYVKKLWARRPQPEWKEVYQKCKTKFPNVQLPKQASFIRRMQRLIRAAG
jgi:hypothetical protein